MVAGLGSVFKWLMDVDCGPEQGRKTIKEERPPRGMLHKNSGRDERVPGAPVPQWDLS